MSVIFGQGTSEGVLRSRISIFRGSDSLGSSPISPRYLSKRNDVINARQHNDQQLRGKSHGEEHRNAFETRDNEKGEKEEEEEISKTISVIPLTVNRWPGLVNSARGKESPLSRERMVSRTLFLSPPPPFLSTPTAFHSGNDRSEPRCIHHESIRPRRNNGERDQGWREDRTGGAGGGGGGSGRRVGSRWNDG